MNSEMGSGKWLLKGIGFQLGVGFTVAMLISQIGTLIFYGEFATGFVPAVVIAILMTAFLVYSIKKADGKRRIMELAKEEM